MSTEEEYKYTCHYGPYKMFDESGNEIEVSREPTLLCENIDIEELRKFVRSVEIKSFKNFSDKIEKKLKNKLKTE